MTDRRRQRIARVEAKRPAGAAVIVRHVDSAGANLDELADAVQALLDRVRRERGG